VEWVETIGRTVEEAKDRALDQLGIDVQEAEFEILEEPSKGLFGRLRGDARVRARVAPRVPRPKQERRQRRGRGDARKSGRSGSSTPESKGADSNRAPGEDGGAPSRAEGGERSGRGANGKKPQPAKASSRGQTNGASSTSPKEASVTVSANEQAEIIGEFLEGLVEAFGYEAQVAQEQVDDETVEVSVTGEELGLLIGPKGQTLSSVQDLARTVLQRRATGTYEGRVRIDIAGYRERRREALAHFTEQMAAKVIEDGAPKALEPMHPADRKVVHDTANGIAGVHTVSEGEDRNRRVVIMPGDA
jgi:spoIIIJ-associated protein